jgi:hypothetical protein
MRKKTGARKGPGKERDKMNLLKYVPKSKHAAIRDAYKDEDGIWICLKDGWEASRTDAGAKTIHADTVSELRYQIAGIKIEGR